MTSTLRLAVTFFCAAAAAGFAQTPAPTTSPTPATPDPYTESLRPLVHFTAKANWLNDPNGLVMWDGEFHLFFQHNPTGIEWGNMTWGHAVSKDLVRWTQLDDAIKPDALGTIYSGSAAVDWNHTTGFAGTQGGKPPLVAMYTAAGGKSEESKGRPFTQCLAYSNDNGRTWTKFSGNPVMGHIAAENRDPKIIYHSATRQWIMALYEDGNRFSLHASPDLKKWTKLQELEIPGCSECPDFFPLLLDGDKAKVRWIFTVANARYLVGTFEGNPLKFVPEGGEGGLKQTDFGRNFYAVQSFNDVRALGPSRIQMAWMRGPRLKDMPFNQQMSFPTEVALKSTPEDGPRLFRTPYFQIRTLHDDAGKVQGTCTTPGKDDGWLAGLKAEAFHITAEFDVGSGGATEVGLVIFGEPIRYTVADRTLHALGDAKVELSNGRLSLELIVDRGSIETFAQHGRVAMASCFDPKPNAPPVSVLITGESAAVTIVALPLKSMWETNK